MTKKSVHLPMRLAGEEVPKKEFEAKLYSASKSLRSGRILSSSTLLMIWSFNNNFSSSSAEPPESVDNNDDNAAAEDAVFKAVDLDKGDNSNCEFSSAVKITTHSASEAITTVRTSEQGRRRIMRVNFVQSLFSLKCFFWSCNHDEYHGYKLTDTSSGGHPFPRLNFSSNFADQNGKLFRRSTLHWIRK
jgi:hypothetical protein